MSLSRSPSPVPGGGWASPGLNITSSGRSSPARSANGAGSSSSPVVWESARLKQGSSSSTGYPSFSTQNQGFFTRHMRKLSSSLPRFNSAGSIHHAPYADKEKLGRGRWSNNLDNVPLLGRLKAIFGRMGRKLKLRLLIAFIVFLCIYIFYHSRESLPSTWFRCIGGRDLGQKRPLGGLNGLRGLDPPSPLGLLATESD